MTSYVDSTPQATVHANHHNTLDAAVKANAAGVAALDTRMTAQEKRAMIAGPAGADGERGPKGDPGPRGAASTVPGPAGKDGVVSKLADGAGNDVTSPKIVFGPGLAVQPPTKDAPMTVVMSKLATVAPTEPGDVLTLDDNLELSWEKPAGASGGETVEQVPTGSVVTLDAAAGGVFALTLSATTTVMLNATQPAAGTFVDVVLLIKQGASNTYAVTWPTSVRWSNGAAPAMTRAGATYAIVLWTTDGGTTWMGTPAGGAY